MIVTVGRQTSYFVKVQLVQSQRNNKTHKRELQVVTQHSNVCAATVIPDSFLGPDEIYVR